MASAPGQAREKKSVVGTIVGVAVGLVFSQMFGAAMLLFPVAFGVLSLWLLGKFGPERARPFASAASVVIGHLGWMMVGALAVPSKALFLAVDVVLLGGAVTWLLLRPGLAAALTLGILELLAAFVNLSQLGAASGAFVEKALTLHVLLRLVAMALLVVGYVKFRRQPQLSTAAVAQVFE